MFNNEKERKWGNRRIYCNPDYIAARWVRITAGDLQGLTTTFGCTRRFCKDVRVDEEDVCWARGDGGVCDMQLICIWYSMCVLYFSVTEECCNRQAFGGCESRLRFEIVRFVFAFKHSLMDWVDKKAMQ